MCVATCGAQFVIWFLSHSRPKSSCGIPCQARNQGGIWGIYPPPKFSKHSTAILTYMQKLSKN